MRSEQEKTVSDLEKEKHISVAKDTFLRRLSVIQHVVKTCCCRRVSRRRSLVRQPAHGRRAQRIHRVRHAAARRAASRLREPPRAMMSCWHGMCCAYSGASRSSGMLHTWNETVGRVRLPPGQRHRVVCGKTIPQTFASLATLLPRTVCKQAGRRGRSDSRCVRSFGPEPVGTSFLRLRTPVLL